MFAAQSKTALSAAKDFIALCRKLPEGYEPTVRLTTGSYKGRFGEVRKPVLQIIGRVAIEKDPTDEIPF